MKVMVMMGNQEKPNSCPFLVGLDRSVGAARGGAEALLPSSLFLSFSLSLSLSDSFGYRTVLYRIALRKLARASTQPNCGSRRAAPRLASPRLARSPPASAYLRICTAAQLHCCTTALLHGALHSTGQSDLIQLIAQPPRQALPLPRYSNRRKQKVAPIQLDRSTLTSIHPSLCHHPARDSLALMVHSTYTLGVASSR